MRWLKDSESKTEKTPFMYLKSDKIPINLTNNQTL